MSAYKNTLRTGDQVWDIERKRRGLVSAQPREKSVMIAIIYDGITTPKPVYVGDLRYIEPGKKPEEHELVPPIEGDLPTRPETSQPPRPPRQPSHPVIRLVPVTPLESMENRRATIKERRDSIQKEFVDLGKEDERLEQAIKVLRAV